MFSLPAMPSLTPHILANVSSKAVEFVNENSWASFLTNSFLIAICVMLLVMWVAKKATTNMTLVPHKWQNVFEAIVEFLYSEVEKIVGPKQAPRAFPMLATLFLFILLSNWIGLLPGVGTVGWGAGKGFLTIGTGEHDMKVPLIRPPTADLNLTIGLAVSVFILWLILTFRELGVWGFIVHTFGPKGGLKGVMGKVVAVIFLLVGVIELVSIAIRPLTLSVRLYGNIYAGEAVIHAMSSMLDDAGPVLSMLGGILFPLPFYFMELLVGLLQAMVFTLLSAVYIQLSTTHDEHHDEEGAHH